MPILNKRLCKSLLGVPQRCALPDAEYHNMMRFLRGVLIGSGRECKDWHLDVAPFMTLFRPDWERLYAHYKEKQRREWPVFEEPDKLTFVTCDDDVEVVSLSDWQYGSS